MRSFLPSVALVTAAFLFGCQDMGSGPVGLEGPQFNRAVPVNDENEAACEDEPGFIFDDKGHCHAGEEDETEAASYTVTHFGDITTIPSSATGRPASGKPGTGVWFGSTAKIVLSDAFVDGVLVLHTDAELCFPGMAFGFVGATLRLRKNRGVTGSYFFVAFGTDGVTPVVYELRLTGTVTSGAFAPGPDETTTVTWGGMPYWAPKAKARSRPAPQVVPAVIQACPSRPEAALRLSVSSRSSYRRVLPHAPV